MSTSDHARRRAPTAISSPSADPGLLGDHHRRHRPALQPRQQAVDHRHGVVLHRAGRQAVGDHDDEVVLAGLEPVVGRRGAGPGPGAAGTRRGRRPASARPDPARVAERGDRRVGVQRRCARRRGPGRGRRRGARFSAVGSAVAGPSETPPVPGSRRAAPSHGSEPIAHRRSAPGSARGTSCGTRPGRRRAAPPTPATPRTPAPAAARASGATCSTSWNDSDW